MDKHRTFLSKYSKYPLLLFILITLFLLPFSVAGQCPPTGCTYVIFTADSGSYVVNPGEKICLIGGADFTGTINLYGGSLENCATGPQSFTINTLSTGPKSTITNYGIFDFPSNLIFSDSLIVNNHSSLILGGDLDIINGAILNNFDSIAITDQLDLQSELNNSGTMTVGTSIIGNTSGVLINTGNLTANNWSASGPWSNSGIITINFSLVYNASSIGTVNGGCISSNNWTNRGTITGVGCGNITIANTSQQTATGVLAGDLAIIDASPPGASPFIDNPAGTIGAGILWSSCTSCVLTPPEEICGNTIDDNGDGRTDEPFPGGVQADLQLWLKAETGTNTTTDGSDIISWADQSINAYSANADVNSTDDPTFTENAINFNPGIDFDGTFTDGYSDGLHLGADYIFGEKDGLHVFIVCDTDVPVGTDKHIFDFGLAANGGYGMIYSDNDYGMYTNNSSGGTNTELFHTEGEEPALVEMKIDFDDAQEFYRNGSLLSSVPVTIPDLDITKVNEASVYGSTPANATTGPVSIGRKSASVYLDQNGGRIFDGRISEVLVFTDTLSSLEKQKVNSYLAIKYGLTTNQDYISSSGSVKKDISDGYANDIAGIGRDNCSGLHQKQSKSIESDAIITIGQGAIAATNDQNANSIASDGAYLVWGNDGGFANFWDNSIVSIPGVDLSRIERTWRLSEHFDITNVLFQIEVDNPNFDLPFMPVSADGIYYLLLDDDGDFTNGGTTYESMSLISGDVWRTLVANPTSSYFSIGVGQVCDAKAPVLSK